MSEVYVKLFSESLIHNGYSFKVGLNEIMEEWNPDTNCTPGGFYFSRREDIAKWINLYEDVKYFSYVSIPHDALFSNEKYVLKANKIIIHEFRQIHELDWNIEDCKVNGFVIKFIKEPTSEICLEAIKQNIYAVYAIDHKFSYLLIKEQTPEICLRAVKENGLFLKFVEEQTPEICLEAVKQNGFALQYVKEQTPQICLEAVKNEGKALQHVKEQTHEICLEAVKEDTYAFFYVKERTTEICLEFVRRDLCGLRHIKDQTHELCLEAVKNNGEALQFVKEQTSEICLEAVKQNEYAIHYVKPEFKYLFDKPSSCVI